MLKSVCLLGFIFAVGALSACQSVNTDQSEAGKGTGTQSAPMSGSLLAIRVVIDEINPKNPPSQPAELPSSVPTVSAVDIAAARQVRQNLALASDSAVREQAVA